MITEIQIGYFQAHKDSAIEFDSGVNVITGTSDAGKSSITRLIEWVVMNRPSGEEFKNWDIPKKGAVTGQIIFDDGFICKERGKENVYETPEGLLKALRTDLPPEITNVTRMSEINIQSQHSPYFLIGEKPAEVTRKLNEIVGLTVIDRLFGNINKRLYALRTNLKYEEKGIDHDREEIARLTPYRKLKKKYDRLIILCTERDVLNTKKVKLEASLMTVKEAITKKAKYAGYPLIEHKVNSLLESVKEYNQKISQHKALSALFKTIGTWQDRKAYNSEWLSLSIPIAKLASQTDLLKTLKDKALWLEKDLKQVRGIIGLKKERELQIADLLGKYKMALIEAKVCPTCIRPITKKEAERIVGGL